MRAGDAQACIKQNHAVKHRYLAMMYLCTSDVVTDVRSRYGMNGRRQTNSLEEIGVRMLVCNQEATDDSMGKVSTCWKRIKPIYR